MEPLSILFVGKTGAGKSSTLNTLLGEEVSKTGAGDSVTKECSSWTRLIFEETVRVIDTPGFADTSMDDNLLMKVDDFLLNETHGIHAFVLVLSAAFRPTAEEINVIKQLEDKFGSNMKSFLLVLVTRAEDLEEDGDDGLIEFVSSYKGYGADVLSECIKSGRLIGFDNACKEKREVQVKSFLAKVKFLREENKGSFYTPAMFAERRKENRQRELERQMQLRAEEKRRQQKEKERDEAKTKLKEQQKREENVRKRMEDERRKKMQEDVDESNERIRMRKRRKEYRDDTEKESELARERELQERLRLKESLELLKKKRDVATKRKEELKKRVDDVRRQIMQMKTLMVEEKFKRALSGIFLDL